MAGRRVQYLHPVKMYIFISVVYFLLLFQSGNALFKVNDNSATRAHTQKVIDSLKKEISNDKSMTAVEKIAVQKKIDLYTGEAEKYAKNADTKSFDIGGDSTVKQYDDYQRKLPPARRDGFWERTIDRKLLAYHQKYRERAGEVFSEQLQHNMPKIMFVLLPLFALILGVTFRKSKKYYVEHLIYAFHFHCFMFLFFGIILIVNMLIPKNSDLGQWLMLIGVLYTLWYFYKSLRVVYHRNRLRTITKLTGVTLSYLICYTVCFVLLILITAVTIA